MIKKKRDRNDQKNVLVFLGGVGKGGGGVSSVFPPQGSSKTQGKKAKKKTGEKKPRKGKKKKRGFNQKRPVCTQNALRRFRQGFEEKTPRFGECREVRVDFISFFGEVGFWGEGAVLGCFPPFPQPQVGGVSSIQKKLFCPKVKLEEQECGSGSFP